ELSLERAGKKFALGRLRSDRLWPTRVPEHIFLEAGAMRRSSPPRERRGGTAPRHSPGGSFFVEAATGKNSRSDGLHGRRETRNQTDLAEKSAEATCLAFHHGNGASSNSAQFVSGCAPTENYRSRSRFDISSRIFRSSLVRESMPCSEILSSTRFSSSALPSRRRLGESVTARLATIALLLATMSSTSSPRSRRGRLRGMARGGSSTSGRLATRCRTWSMPAVAAMRMYTYAAITPPMCAK